MSEDYKSIVPSTGDLGIHWPDYFNLPQGRRGKISSAGWTDTNEGFIQQTFLGASIRNFNITAGFGDTSSTLSISLVEDELNNSDFTGIGSGNDVYHSGVGDNFAPPPVGSPVFFKFGKNWASVEQAWLNTLDQLYPGITDEDYKRSKYPEFEEVEQSGAFTEIPQGDEDSLPEGKDYFVLTENDEKNLNTEDDDQRVWEDRSKLYQFDELKNGETRGYDHLVFGGILQSYTENKSQNGNPLFDAQVVDPREILSNVQLILGNYADTTYNNQNMVNVYGFLEHDPSDQLKEKLELECSDKWVFAKRVIASGLEVGKVKYIGESQFTFQETEARTNPRSSESLLDVYEFKDFLPGIKLGDPIAQVLEGDILPDPMPQYFPITGEGFSRRSDLGIPWYRVSQALGALWELNGQLPKEYKEAGFGGEIDFRGFNYIVDFRGFPLEKIPDVYFLDFEQIDLLSLCQELCDIISHDLFVSLQPVVNHPAYKFLYSRNKYFIENDEPDRIVHGVIKIDAIDRSKQPEYGKIQEYLDELDEQGIYVENQDVGFELSNVVTDKLVAGAQEVNMYLFSSQFDRDTLEYRKKIHNVPNFHDEVFKEQWSLETSLKQQVLPFYGFLGKNAVTIPRGFGSYQQIMLDASDLDAIGVGDYYVATEMELRHALISYERWREFLVEYNDIYIEELTENKAFFEELSTTDEYIEGFTDVPDSFGLGDLANREFGVSVPRCVFNSEKGFEFSIDSQNYWTDAQEHYFYNPKDIRFLGATPSISHALDSYGLPASPCSPPYGYPLYYQRAAKIGIPQVGIIRIGNAINNIRNIADDIRDILAKDPQAIVDPDKKEPEVNQTQNAPLSPEGPMLTKDPSESFNRSSQQPASNQPDMAEVREANTCAQETMKQIKADWDGLDKTVIGEKLAYLENVLERSAPIQKSVNKLARNGEKNARKVYNFIKSVAEENLGKKFLVKIPKYCNNNYSIQGQFEKLYERREEEQGVVETVDKTEDVLQFQDAPFGFPARPVSSEGQNVFGLSSWATDSATRSSLEFQSTSRLPAPYQRFLYIEPFEKTQWPKLAPIDLEDEEIINQYPENLYVTVVNDDYKYSNGALKNHWNPVSDKWEFNYKPDSQGGFFDFGLFPRNLSAGNIFNIINNQEFSFLNPNKNAIPPVVLQQFAPRDLTNFINENGRVSSYVRFDNSQFLDFTQVGAGNVYQEIITPEGRIPDIMDDLENVNPNQPDSFEQSRGRELLTGEYKRPNAVAFVRCQVDENFYMAPKILMGQDSLLLPSQTGCQAPETFVFGRNVVWQPSYSKPEVLQFVNDEGENEVVCGKSVTTPLFRVAASGGVDGTRVNNQDFFRRYNQEKDSWEIVVEKEELDPEHVWALITLPGRIKPTEAKRYVDAYYNQINPKTIKSIMTQDVVRGWSESEKALRSLYFDKPAAVQNESIPIDCEKFTFTELNNAQTAQRDSKSAFNLSNPEIQIKTVAPSPVYPDIVALPLMSNERCYGPWYSSFYFKDDADNKKPRYIDVGGKSEFIKNENLAPWNYAGYQLMNDAGKLEAEFSNSLLLFTERGGFVFPDLPSGILISKELKEKGPIVTSVSVDIGDSVKTTVKLDLYTSRFGKLQKQKEIAIAQMARERQRIIDDRNRAIRQGVRNAAGNVDAFPAQGNQIFDFYTSLERGQTVYDGIYASVEKQTSLYSYEDQNISIDKYYLTSSTQAKGYLEEAVGIDDDKAQKRKRWLSHAGGKYNSLFQGADNSAFSEYFPHKGFIDADSIIRRTSS